MRKVYGLLAVQLSITTLIGAVFLFTPGVKEFVQVSHDYHLLLQYHQFLLTLLCYVLLYL